MILSFLNDVPYGIFRMDHTKQRFNKNENEHKEYLKNIYILSSSYNYTYTYIMYVSLCVYIYI